MDKNIAFIGPSINLPNLVNVIYSTYNLYKLQFKTWEKRLDEIIHLTTIGEVDGVIIYMPTSFLLQASQDNYSELFVKFLYELDKTKTILIVYEENLYENFDYYDYELEEYITKKELVRRISSAIKIEIEENGFRPYPYLGSIELDQNNPLAFIDATGIRLDLDSDKLVLALRRLLDFESRKDQISNFIEQIFKSNISIVPFKDKLEIRTRVQNFVFEIVKEIFFSVFLKKGQPLYEEFETFIKIFEKYIQNVEGILITLETESYENGISFNFKSKNSSIDFDKFYQAIDRFSHFMDLCQSDPEAALHIINKRVGNVGDSLTIIQDLSKKYKRLLLDIQHQKEKILLLARQELESNIEVKREKNSYIKLSEIESVTYPLTQGKANILTLNKTESYSTEEQEILRIVEEEFDSKIYLETKSNLDKLKSTNLPKEEKRNSMIFIKGQIIKAAKKVASHAETIGIKVLTAYLENLVK